jgi:soluble lytic murein transglycosylase-like protein
MIDEGQRQTAAASEAPGLAILREYVRRAAQSNSIPEHIAMNLIQRESGWRMDLRGAHGEYGLCQIREIAARDVSRSSAADWKANPLDNIDVGMKYLKLCHDRCGRWDVDADTRWRLALYAYNWGFGNVEKYMSGRIGVPYSVVNYADTVMTGGNDK